MNSGFSGSYGCVLDVAGGFAGFCICGLYNRASLSSSLPLSARCLAHLSVRG